MAGVASVRSGIEAHCHSVYYRAMKKTLTPLNDVYMRAAFDMRHVCDALHLQYDNASNTRATRAPIQIDRVAKRPMK